MTFSMSILPKIMRTLKENRNYIGVAAGLLLGGMVIGSVVGASLPSGGTPLSDSTYFQALEPILQLYQPYTPFTVLFLFAKNSLTGGLCFLMGPLLLLSPLGIPLLNGFIVGFVGSAVATQRSLLLAVESLAPHGVFELTALVFSSAAGLHFGVSAIKKAFGMVDADFSLRSEFLSAARLFLLALALFAIAAVLETYVTPYIVGLP